MIVNFRIHGDPSTTYYWPSRSKSTSEKDRILRYVTNITTGISHLAVDKGGEVKMLKHILSIVKKKCKTMLSA